jgi:hypothetical protein
LLDLIANQIKIYPGLKEPDWPVAKRHLIRMPPIIPRWCKMASPSVKRSLIAILLVLFALPGLALLPAPAAADYYDIKAYIDGVSDLVIKGNTLQWHNNATYAPGQFPGTNYPTIITTNSNPVPINWYPDWPSGTYGNVWSSVYTGLTPALPHIPQRITLTKVQARKDISILQYPSAANDYTLIVRFDDGLPGGAAWYEARVNLVPVTIPGILLLLE